jgi:hypothetical protein
MEETRTASWRRPLVVLAAIGAAAMLWLGVSAAMASGGSSGPGGAGSGGSSLPVQDGTAPEEERQDRDRRDCPEKERAKTAGAAPALTTRRKPSSVRRPAGVGVRAGPGSGYPAALPLAGLATPTVCGRALRGCDPSCAAEVRSQQTREPGSGLGE